MAASPFSSPRLPSPPPIAEDQLGPKSPIEAGEQQRLSSNLDHVAGRRIRPGTKAEDMAEGPPLLDLSEIDSAFQLTEHLKALHQFLTHPIGTDSTIAVDKDIALKIAHPPENVDKTLWLYELCRFLTLKVNSVITALFSDSPPCSSTTCPEMRASEWQYLCAVHDPPKSCCAIDYCCHTLDWAANTLTSPKTFPSRLTLGADQGTQHQQVRHLTNIFRRVYRIFAHAWFQHREMFWKVEGRSGLYILFKAVCDVYDLIPEDNYTIPPEAEGIEAPREAPPVILRRQQNGPARDELSKTSIIEGMADHTLSAAGTTKRHRHSPSVGAGAVTTVVEENEDDDDGASKDGSETAVLHAEVPTESSEAGRANAASPEEPKNGEGNDLTKESEAAAASEPAQEAEKEQPDQQNWNQLEEEEGPVQDEEKDNGLPEEQPDISEIKEADTEEKTEVEATPDVEETSPATNLQPPEQNQFIPLTETKNTNGKQTGPEAEAEAEPEKVEAPADPDVPTDVKEPEEKAEPGV